MPNDPLAFLNGLLDARRHAGLYRSLRDLSNAPGTSIEVNGKSVLLLCSNNYLGLATDDRLKVAAKQAIDVYGCGATGSRLISGNLEPYRLLEDDLARFKSTESSLVFTSGFAANAGTVPALVGEGDAIFSDALNHASLIDGCRLSGTETLVYRHCDVEDLERKLSARNSARRRLILTESVFSMDGDLAPLRDIAALARKHDAMLMTDESHATGVYGPTGAGLVEELGLQDQVQVQMGTFSKALGSLGGYIAGSKALTTHLLQQARSFVFSTGLPPGVLAASREAIRIVREEPERRKTLWRNAGYLRSGLRLLGYELSDGASQIIPIVIGDSRATMAMCRYLLRRGVFVQGVRPPTVPEGTARLRLAPTAAHSTGELDRALSVFEELRSILAGRINRNSVLK